MDRIAALLQALGDTVQEPAHQAGMPVSDHRDADGPLRTACPAMASGVPWW